MAGASDSAPVLEDHDGFVETMYHMLWAKDFAGEPCRSVRIPDVIIYKYRIAVRAQANTCCARALDPSRPRVGAPTLPTRHRRAAAAPPPLRRRRHAPRWGTRLHFSPAAHSARARSGPTGCGAPTTRR